MLLLLVLASGRAARNPAGAALIFSTKSSRRATGGRAMSVRRRIFLVNQDESVRQIPTSRHDRLWGEPPLRMPEFADQRVMVAEVFVDCVERSPVQMWVHSPHFLCFDRIGALKQEQSLHEAGAYLELCMAPPADTAARFMRRRLDHQHRWEVTPRIFAHIADAVFGRSGWVAPPSRKDRSSSARARRRIRKR
jgi:hypothetical protein